jgi:hypothetical protein
MDPGCEHWQDFAPGDCRSVGYPYCFIGAYWEYYWARDDGPSCARAAEAIKTFGQETSGCYGESEPLPECKNSSNTTAMPLHALAKNSDSNWHVIDLNVVGVLVSAMFMAVGLVSLAMPMKFRYAGSVADPGPLLGQSVLKGDNIDAKSCSRPRRCAHHRGRQTACVIPPLFALAKSDSNWHIIDLNVVGAFASAMVMAIGLVSLAMSMEFRYAGPVADPGPLLGQSAF